MKLSIAPIALAVAVALALSPLAASVATAAKPATNTSWSVAPSGTKGPDGRESFAYSVSPGVQISDYLAVSNSGTTATTFSVYGTDAINDAATGAFSLLQADQKPVDIGSWIKVAQTSITIQPGKEAIIPFTVLVPSDATPGDHTAGIVASVFKKATKGGKAITLEQRVGARFYLHVAGAATAAVSVSGLVSSFAPSLNPFGSGSSKVSYSVMNSGNYRVDVAQQLDITGPFGIPLGHIKGKPILNLIPGQSVEESFTSPNIAPLLLVWANVSLVPGNPTDVVKESAMRTQNGKPAAAVVPPKYHSVSSSTFTGAIPWILLVIVIVLIAAVWLLARYLSASRQQVYEAIDAAAAKAREGALADAEKQADESARVKEPVA